MKRPTGKLLSPEETIRLAIAGSVDRQKLIEAIAKRLRDDELENSKKIGAKKAKGK